MKTKKYTGDPAFKAEIEAIAANHRTHRHEEACWGEPYESVLPAVRFAAARTRTVQKCRVTGAVREVPA